MSEVTEQQLHKLEALRQYLRQQKRVAVAFSGGVDSTFLLKVAKETLGDQVVALTAKSSVFPRREYQETVDFCESEGIRQVICHRDELSKEAFVKNPPNRCYICKKALFEDFLQEAGKQGINSVVEGSNMDDLGDYRPGLAAVKELGILSPLVVCGFTKADIRALSKQMGLSTWNKPSYACLASRFVYGEAITREKLKRIDEAEQVLLDMNFAQMRVRIHGDMARIEVLPEEMARFMEEGVRLKIAEEFKRLGFAYVTLDLHGYRTGSMNEQL